MESSVMFNLFRTDDEIEDFWARTSDAWVLLWGSRLNILAIQ
jgi:hypothetical protein